MNDPWCINKPPDWYYYFESYVLYWIESNRIESNRIESYFRTFRRVPPQWPTQGGWYDRSQLDGGRGVGWRRSGKSSLLYRPTLLRRSGRIIVPSVSVSGGSVLPVGQPLIRNARSSSFVPRTRNTDPARHRGTTPMDPVVLLSTTSWLDSSCGGCHPGP